MSKTGQETQEPSTHRHGLHHVLSVLENGQAHLLEAVGWNQGAGQEVGGEDGFVDVRVHGLHRGFEWAEHLLA